MADRRKMGTKDMVMTMSIVLVVVALIALYGSNVSFVPGARPQQGEAPTADVLDGFAHAGATLDFPITAPVGLPGDWHPNSFTVSDPDASNDGLAEVGTLQAVRGGWITRHYGDPAQGVHAIQMELAMRGYLDERGNWPPLWDETAAEPLQATLRHIINSCLDFAREDQ